MELLVAVPLAGRSASGKALGARARDERCRLIGRAVSVCPHGYISWIRTCLPSKSGTCAAEQVRFSSGEIAFGIRWHNAVQLSRLPQNGADGSTSKRVSIEANSGVRG